MENVNTSVVLTDNPVESALEVLTGITSLAFWTSMVSIPAD